MAEYSDSDLVLRSMQNDLDAYGTLVERHEAMLISAAYAVTGDYPRAQEVAQDAFVTCFRKLHQLKEPGAFKSWARQAAVNLARNTLRSRPATVAPDIAASLAIASGEDGAFEQLEKMETRQAVAAALEKLPDDQRELLFFRHYEDMNLAEIAERLGVTTSTVSKQLSAAHKKMKFMLDGKIGALAGGE